MAGAWMELSYLLVVVAVSARKVRIQTDTARRDVTGAYIDAHDGKILHHNGTYFLYGESYGNQTLATPYPWSSWPRLKVYTSPDLIQWKDRGDPLPMIQVSFTQSSPSYSNHRV